MERNTGVTPRLRWRAEISQYLSDDYPRIGHGIKVAFAATLSMGLCMLLQLREPSTAMVSCVIVMLYQQSGMIIGRGFYRCVGELCGSIAGLVLVSFFSQQPWMYLLVLATWIGACTFGSSYLRNFQSYGLVLAGYATAVTSLPSLTNPYDAFDYFVYTISEVVIGVTIASLASALVFPRRVVPELYAASAENISNLFSAVHSFLCDPEPQADLGNVLKLLRERANVQNLRTGAVFEDPKVRLQKRVFLRLDTSYINALVSAHSLHQIKMKITVEAGSRATLAAAYLIESFLAIFPDRLSSGTSAECQLEIVADQLGQFECSIAGQVKTLLDTIWDEPPSDCAHIEMLGAAMQDLVVRLHRVCRDFVEARRSDDQTWRWSLLHSIVHVDSTRAATIRLASLIDGVRAAAAILTVGALWLASGWENGSNSLVSVSMFSSLYAIAPNPAAATWQMFCGVLGGVIAGFFCSFVVLPQSDNFSLLALCMGIPIMVGCYVNTFPKTSVLGMGFAVFFCLTVDITNPVTYNPVQFLDTSFGLLAGVAAAAVAFSIVVPHAGRLVSAHYFRQLHALITHSTYHPGTSRLAISFESRMRAVIMRIAIEPARQHANEMQLIAAAFAALQIGRTVIHVRQGAEHAGDQLPGDWEMIQHEWLDAISDMFSITSPEAKERAIFATRRAKHALLLLKRSDSPSSSFIASRMFFLFDFAEVILRDQSLRPWQGAKR
ncbi:FUSC family protein [Paraburkholderia sp. XV]|uniref:FUSC family protein n=1 Tax=Paraburkholderia sp. XV TaxID=2831520 RepID=UPI001CD6E52A|nr:FUSC family protein [Paraburkholderia sp. XV]